MPAIKAPMLLPTTMSMGIPSRSKTLIMPICAIPIAIDAADNDLDTVGVEPFLEPGAELVDDVPGRVQIGLLVKADQMDDIRLCQGLHDNIIHFIGQIKDNIMVIIDRRADKLADL